MISHIKTIEPFFDYVLIKLVTQTRTKEGIIIPGTIEDKNLAEVVAIGPGRKGIEVQSVPDVKPGDKVLIAKYIGTKVVLDGVEHILVKGYDLQAKVELTEEG